MKKKSQNEKARKWKARRRRVQSGLAGSERHRLTVFRSAKHIYAQISEAGTGVTIASASSLSKGVVPEGTGTGNVEAAKKVGAAIAVAARERKIESVVFNRNGFLYHGRVKALADAAREAGLSI